MPFLILDDYIHSTFSIMLSTLPIKLLHQHITYLLLLFGLTSTLFIIIRASLLWATGVFGASQGACVWFAGPAAGCGASTTAFLVGLHEFWNKLRTVQILLWLPRVVLSEEDQCGKSVPVQPQLLKSTALNRDQDELLKSILYQTWYHLWFT